VVEIQRWWQVRKVRCSSVKIVESPPYALIAFDFFLCREMNLAGLIELAGQIQRDRHRID